MPAAGPPEHLAASDPCPDKLDVSARRQFTWRPPLAARSESVTRVPPGCNAGLLVCGAEAAAVSQPGPPVSGPYFAPVLLETSDFGAAQAPLRPGLSEPGWEMIGGASNARHECPVYPSS